MSKVPDTQIRNGNSGRSSPMVAVRVSLPAVTVSVPSSARTADKLTHSSLGALPIVTHASGVLKTRYTWAGLFRCEVIIMPAGMPPGVWNINPAPGAQWGCRSTLRRRTLPAIRRGEGIGLNTRDAKCPASAEHRNQPSGVVVTCAGATDGKATMSGRSRTAIGRIGVSSFRIFLIVIPAKAGIQAAAALHRSRMDSRFRGNDVGMRGC